MTIDASSRVHSPTVLFLILGAMSAFMPVAMDMYLPALPAIGDELGVDDGIVQLTLSSFFVGVGVGQFAYGPTSDRVGRRLPLFIGSGIFALASIGCAFAPTIEALIALRLLQGLGASSGMVIARAVVFESFGVREGARYMSALMLIMGIAPIIAPLLGGWVVIHASWRAIFHIVGGFAALALAAAFFQLPETRSKEAALASRGESPIASYVAVLRNGPLMAMATIGALGGASFFTYLANAPAMLIGMFGIPADQFGYYFAANAISFIGAAQINRALLSRMQPLAVLDRCIYVTFALTLVVLAGAIMAPQLGMWGVLAPLFVLIGTFPFVNQNAGAVAQGEDMERTGAVSAVIGAMAVLSGAATAAISGAFHDGTPRPMAITMVVTMGFALLIRLTTRKPPH